MAGDYFPATAQFHMLSFPRKHVEAVGIEGRGAFLKMSGTDERDEETAACVCVCGGAAEDG